MRWLRSAIGAGLTLLAGCAALVLVLADRVAAWRARRESRARAERLKAKVRAARHELDTRRAELVHSDVERIRAKVEAEKTRDAVDVANELIDEARRGK